MIKIENPRALTPDMLSALLQVGKAAGVSQLIVQSDGGFQAIFGPPEQMSAPVRIEMPHPLTAEDLKRSEAEGDLYGSAG